jgi:hypothetical protein
MVKWCRRTVTDGGVDFGTDWSELVGGGPGLVLGLFLWLAFPISKIERKTGDCRG